MSRRQIEPDQTFLRAFEQAKAHFGPAWDTMTAREQGNEIWLSMRCLDVEAALARDAEAAADRAARRPRRVA